MRAFLRMRPTRAKTLLLKGERFKTIAAHMGFVDEWNSVRVFKGVEGMSPRAYLRRIG
jgi:AraC-like DNA-binding protein